VTDAGDRAIDVLALGEPLVAIGTSGPGELELTPYLAGAEVNVAVGAARLGASSAVVGRVGDDRLGRFVRDGLRREGVDARALVVDRAAPTGLFVKEVDPATGEPTRRYCRTGSAGSRLQPAQVPDHLLRRARAVVVSGLTALLSASAAETARRALVLAREQRALGVLDLNLRVGLAGSGRATDLVGDLLPHAALVLGGRAEVADVLGLPTSTPLQALAAAAAECHGRDVTVVVRSAAGAGALAHGAWEAVDSPALDQVVDASGAGDAFTAGFVVATLRRERLAQRLRLGVECAVSQLRTPGDCDGVGVAVRGAP
jgi:2-dehydro-3-deoxygluconokinase